MHQYYLNSQTQTNGDHEVHLENCVHLPTLTNRILLGIFSKCTDAISIAKRKYPDVKINGCIHCSKKCHTS